MPQELGRFISTHVYDDKLRSVHEVSDLACVAFVNASKGREEQQGTSWVVSTIQCICGHGSLQLLRQNHEEVRLVVELVRNYYQHNYPYAWVGARIAYDA